MRRIQADMQSGRRRGNCLAYALLVKLIEGSAVELRFRRSPDFPLLPRVSYRFQGCKQWLRFQHLDRIRKDGWRRWLPLHALWFYGTARRDLT